MHQWLNARYSSTPAEDGMLNLKEFIDLMENFKKPDEEEEDVVQAFRVFDPNETGFVDADELREALAHPEAKVNQADMANLLQFYGLQEGRKIDFEGEALSRHRGNTLSCRAGVPTNLSQRLFHKIALMQQNETIFSDP